MTETGKKTALRSLFAAVLVMLLVTLIPFSAFGVSAASLKLNYSSITITKGSKTTLKATGASNVKWSSSNKSIVTVTSNGTVYAKKSGTAYVYAKTSGQTAKCKVSVVNGKLTLSQSTVNIDEGDSQTITVNATGSHKLKAVSANKSVAKATWIKPWNGNNISLKISGLSAGSTQIKVYMANYTSVYKYVTVNVAAADQEIDPENEQQTSSSSYLLLDKETLNISANKADSFRIYTANQNKVTVVTDNPSVASVSVPVWSSDYGECTVTGVKSGNAVITVSDGTNTKTVKVSVTSNDYYQVSDTSPLYRLSANDLVITWNDGTKVKYMLVPFNFDSAYTNTIFAKDTGKYSYYQIYDSAPAKNADSDVISSFKVTINGKTVVRYTLLPAVYDAVKLQTITAAYNGNYQYYIIYNIEPLKKEPTDVIKTWTATVDGDLYTRYVLLPAGYNESRLDQLKKSDKSSTGTYYAVSVAEPDKLVPTDTVKRFTYTADNGYNKTVFVLLPQGFDQARYDTIVASYTHNYEYLTVYTAEPEKQNSTDEIKTWKKVVDGEAVTRYVLVPAGYDSSFVDTVRNEDTANSSAVYYSAFTTYPSNVNTESGEKVYSWKNPRSNSVKYMILPPNYSVLKRNDVIYNDTGVFEYYTIYSTTPKTKSDKDSVLTFTGAEGTYYMLVPENYSSEKVNNGINGL